MMFGILVGTGLALQVTTELLPAPTGPHRTGRMTFHWKDSVRAELETSAPDDKRELMVHVFYPADARASGARAPYMPDVDVMRGPINDSSVARIAGLRAYSIENAPIAQGRARYPVVIIQPGGGMKGLTYHVFAEDLASHGWIVVAIDPPYNARGVRFPDGRVAGNLQPAERGWGQARTPEEGERFYIERVAHMARDISFVIDRLASLDRSGPFTRRLDLARVGALGHSRGGQVAGSVRLLDARVKGAINLDGTAGPYGGFLPVGGDTSSGRAPFMWIVKPPPPPPSDAQLERNRRTRAQFDEEVGRIQASWDRRLAGIGAGALKVTLNRGDVQHIDFSDEPFWDGTMTAQNRDGRLRTIAETRTWIRAFFDGSVGGDWSSLHRMVGDSASLEPGVTVRTYGRLVPGR